MLGLLVITAHIVNTYTLCPLVMPYHNPLKVITPTFQMMKLGELVLGFKSQLECLDLLCLWSTVLEGPQCTQTNQTLIKIFYLQMPLYHYLSSTSQCTCPLSSSLSPSFSQYSWTAASVVRCSLESYCCQDKMWLFYLRCDPGQSQNSQEPETIDQRKFSLRPEEVRGYDHPGGMSLRRWDQEDAKQHFYAFYFTVMLSPEIEKEWTGHSHMCSPGLPRQH